jgi:pSer/pThr/pTyr-binding forkhead associated (FHA) protein
MDLRHRDVSRHHCAFEIEPPVVRVRDLGSLNGTYVNGEMIGQRTKSLAPDELDRKEPMRELSDGDEVRVGANTIRVMVEALGLVTLSSG